MTRTLRRLKSEHSILAPESVREYLELGIGGFGFLGAFFSGW
jgi:hypothetical protein